jgi:hypothetical protein
MLVLFLVTHTHMYILNGLWLPLGLPNLRQQSRERHGCTFQSSTHTPPEGTLLLLFHIQNEPI